MGQTNPRGSGSSPTSNSKERSAGHQLWVLAAIVPMVALVALLAWGMVKAGGKPGGLGINSKLGEVKIRQGPAQDFSLSLFDGGTIQLSSLKGKVVMVDFWASWCIPCRQEAPTLAKVYKDYEGKAVEFVGIDIWDKEGEARAYLRQFGVTYPNGLDNSGSIAINYGVTGIPEKYFIGSDGVLVKKFVGPMDEERLKAELDALLAAR